MMSVAKKWRDWKTSIEVEFYTPYLTDEERMLHHPKRVAHEQWRALIDYWNSPEGKERSIKAKANRARQNETHTTGTHSFVQIRDIKEKMKKLMSQLPDDAQDDPLNNDIFAQVMEKDKSGFVHTCGLGPTPSDFWGKTPSRLDYMRIATKTKWQADGEIHNNGGAFTNPTQQEVNSLESSYVVSSLLCKNIGTPE